MMFFDRLFLARYSDEAFAASLPAGVMIWTLLAVPLGIVAYSTTFVAQYHGAGNRVQVRKSVWQAIGASILFGIGIVLLSTPLVDLFDSLGHTPDVAKEEKIYFSAMVWICPVRIFVAAIAAFFNGRGQTRTVMAGSLVGMVVNVVLDACLIFGLGPCPRLGILGAAIATVVAMIVNAIYLIVVLLFENRDDADLWWQAAVFDRELSFRMLKFGLPQGVQFLFDIGSFTVVVFLVGRISQEALGATNLAFQINSMLFIPLIGLGQAVSTIVGHRVGEEIPEVATRSVRLAMQLGIAWTLPFIVLFIAAPDWTLWPFHQFASESLARYGPQMPVLLWFVAAYSAFDLMAVVYGAAIRGAGDTRFSLWTFLFVNWGVMVLPLVFFESQGTNSLMRSWTVITLTIATLGVVFWLRYRAGKWKSMSVIEQVVIGDVQLEAPRDGDTDPANHPAEQPHSADSSDRPA